jgi:two-component system sensor histidine kinase KdpD
MDDRLTPGGHYLRMLLIMAAVTAAGFVVRPYLNPTDLAMVVLLGVVFVASRHGRGAGVAASILGIAAYDFLFVPPYYTFDVADKSYFLTFGVMLLVALSLSRLTTTIVEQAEEARERAERSVALLELSHELADARNRQSVVSIATQHAGRSLGGTATMVLADEVELDDGIPRWPAGGVFDHIAVRVAAAYAWQQGESAGSGTTHGADAEALVVPLKTATRRVGVVVLQPEPPDRMVTSAERATAEALAGQTALALELGAGTAKRGEG